MNKSNLSYSPQTRAMLVEELRQRRRRLALPYGAFLVSFIGGTALLDPLVGPWVIIAVIGTALFLCGQWATRIWRCPACEMPLGRSISPARCYHCGVELFGQS